MNATDAIQDLTRSLLRNTQSETDLHLLAVANRLIVAANETRTMPIGAILMLPCPFLQIGATNVRNAGQDLTAEDLAEHTVRDGPSSFGRC